MQNYIFCLYLVKYNKTGWHQVAIRQRNFMNKGDVALTLILCWYIHDSLPINVDLGTSFPAVEWLVDYLLSEPVYTSKETSPGESMTNSLMVST